MLGDYIRKFKRSGDLAKDVQCYLGRFDFRKTADHCAAVAAKARSLAARYDCDRVQAEQAGFLHDISAVIPNDERLDFANEMRVAVLDEEAQFPMILHQKLSVVIARKVFDVSDPDVLSAIGCHTTLKAEASLLDKVVFLADKIAWDQDGQPPYLDEVRAALAESLDTAVLVYLNYLWERRRKLRVLHPWLIEARDEILLIS